MTVNKNIFLFTLPTLLFVLPFFYLPFFTNFFNTPKILLLLTFTIILLASSIIAAIRNQRIELTNSSLNLPLLLISLATLSNLLIIKEARPESLLGKGILILILSICAYLTTSTTVPHRLGRLAVFSFSASSTLLSLYSILHLLFLYRLNFLPSYMQSQAFTPTGAPLISTSVIFIGLVTCLTFALNSNKWRVVGTIASALNLVGLAAHLGLMLPGQPLQPILLPQLAGWSILLDSAKSLKSILFGVGFANFPALYSAVKPLYLNNTPLWNIVPESSSNEIFNLATTGGVLLLASFVIFAITVIHSFSRLHTSLIPLKYGFLATIITLILTPGTIITYSLFFIFGALILADQSSSKSIALSPSSRALFALFGIVLVTLSLYVLGKYTLSDYFLRKAQLALNKAEAKPVYDNTLRAVKLEPSLSSYRISYSQVNLALAGSLSNQKQNPSEEERKQIAQLVSQAIREAKAATVLRPSLSSNWQNMATVYRNLIGVADGSADFAVNYLKQAVSLDAGNPLLRVEYGGLLYQLAKISKDDKTSNDFLTLAATEFQTAIKLKKDYANAYYNLSKTLEALGDKQAAVATLEKAISYLQQDSNDYQTAKTELDTMKSHLPAPSTSPSPTPSTSPNSELATPSPLPSPLSSPIVLPAE